MSKGVASLASTAEISSTNDVYNLLSTYAEKLMSESRESVLEKLVEPTGSFEYHNYDAMVKKLKALNDRYPNITSLYTIGKSVEKRDLWVMIISDQPLVHEAGEPEVKYIGNIHGDESVGRECLLLFIEYLCVNYGKNEYITQLVNNVSIAVVVDLPVDFVFRRTRIGSHSYLTHVESRWFRIRVHPDGAPTRSRTFECPSS